MVYHFKIHKEADGYWAECLELQGCNAQGDDISELEENMKESLNLFLSEPESSKHIFPLPRVDIKKSKTIVKVQVDSSVAFAMLMRQIRINHAFTLKKMASILDYKNINSYVKLEKPKTANPELRTIAKVVKCFNDFPLTLLFEEP